MQDSRRRPPPSPSASTRSPSASDTSTASSFPTSSAAVRSGSAARIGVKRAWTSSIRSSARRGRGRSASLPWTCGSRSAPQPSGVLQTPPFIYDKFHILTHLSSAMDDIRRSEYKRVTGSDRRFIKGQRYNLLRNPDSLTKTGKEALRLLFKANKRLHTAYLLREEFELLWECGTDEQARRFFLRWRQALKWKRLKPVEEFAGLIERHWDGIVNFCRSDHSIPLGFVEGLNNKIRVFQRRAYGLKDQEYLRLKVLTCSLKEI